MKKYRMVLSGVALILAGLVARSGTINELMRGADLQAANSTILTKFKDTSVHSVPCVKIHHSIFQKSPTVSVSTDGKHYLQVFDSKGSKLSEYTFTGKRYKLDTHSMAKGSYTIYVFDEHRKLLDLKPMVVK